MLCVIVGNGDASANARGHRRLRSPAGSTLTEWCGVTSSGSQLLLIPASELWSSDPTPPEDVTVNDSSRARFRSGRLTSSHVGTWELVSLGCLCRPHSDSRREHTDRHDTVNACDHKVSLTTTWSAEATAQDPRSAVDKNAPDVREYPTSEDVLESQTRLRGSALRRIRRRSERREWGNAL